MNYTNTREKRDEKKLPQTEDDQRWPKMTEDDQSGSPQHPQHPRHPRHPLHLRNWKHPTCLTKWIRESNARSGVAGVRDTTGEFFFSACHDLPLQESCFCHASRGKSLQDGLKLLSVPNGWIKNTVISSHYQDFSRADLADPGRSGPGPGPAHLLQLSPGFPVAKCKICCL